MVRGDKVRSDLQKQGHHHRRRRLYREFALQSVGVTKRRYTTHAEYLMMHGNTTRCHCQQVLGPAARSLIKRGDRLRLYLGLKFGDRDLRRLMGRGRCAKGITVVLTLA